MFHKFIQTIPVIGKQTCASIIEEAEERNDWRASNIILKPELLSVSSIRSSESTQITEDYADYQLLLDSVNKAYREYSPRLLDDLSKEKLRQPMPMSPDSTCWLEPFELIRYKPEQHYDWHVDQPHKECGVASTRTMSVVLYLNDDFEGGFTEFVDAPRKAPAGQALMFPSNWTFAHTATPVVEGTKYAIVTWYHIS